MKFTENVRATAESFVKKIQAAEKAIADHQKNGINDYTTAKYQEILFELQEQASEVKREGVAAVNAIIDEYKAALPGRYAASGVELDTGDMALMNSGYKLTQADMEAMFDRYKPENGPANNTMLRAIMDYCEEHGIHLARSYIGEKEKEAAADSLKQYALNCFLRPNYGMESEEYFAQIFPDALAGE